MMKLFLVHCGYYDTQLCDGIYEGHVNFFVVAENFDQAKANAKALPEYKAKRMHIDGLQEIELVNGYRVQLEADLLHPGQTRLHNVKHRDLAPSRTTP